LLLIGIVARQSVHPHGHVHFIAMEMLEGQTLKHSVVAGPMELEQTIDVGIEIADGLDAAHAQGIVIGTSSPQTFFLPGGGHAKIMDFGLAKLVGDHHKAKGLTGAG
jgi:serine/threonine protein kinase